MKPVAQIAACRSSHRRLTASVTNMSDTDFRTPSLLPGYSRGHVVAHLINKAHAHVLVFEGAACGEVRRLHPLDHDPDAAAAAGSRRSADAFRVDLQHAFQTLEAAWDSLREDLWDREAIMMAGPRAMTEVVAHHFRNVEVHHVDLDTGYTPAAWPDEFVVPELEKRLRALPARADNASLLAWLLGRAPAPPLTPW